MDADGGGHDPRPRREAETGAAMRVLVACESSGTVRDAFAIRGHEAWSCDLVPAEHGGNHYQCDVRDVLFLGWDIMVAHPPCERICVSGARWKYEKPNWSQEQAQAIELVRCLLGAPIDRIALENPVGIISTVIRPPTQVIQPWMFGHGETKATCLWLKNLPRLQKTNVVEGRDNRVHRQPPGPNRKKARSWRYAGIAEAMADQWNESSFKRWDDNHKLLWELCDAN
jgi:hypothetical protein